MSIDEKLDFVLFGVATHVTEFFVSVSSQDLVNSSGYSIGHGYFGFVRRA